MPPPSRHRVQMNGPSYPVMDGTLRRREIMPFDSYLYAGNPKMLERLFCFYQLQGGLHLPCAFIRAYCQA